MKTADIDKLKISVNNSNVTVSGNSLVITLTGSYAVPVKGSTYTVKLPEGLVTDDQMHKNVVDNTHTVTHIGVEEPVIRIDKKRETTGTTVTQPLQVDVRIDCQTPGSTIQYTLYTQTNAQVSINSTSSKTTKATINPTKGSTQTYSASFKIGTTNTSNGLIYRINAKATKGSKSIESNEFAYRSIYQITNVQNSDVGSSSSYSKLWVRGSDVTIGSSNISSFPVSWDSAEFNKIRAMTNSTGSTWYWVSWELNKPAYLEPLRGDMPNDAADNGPSVWCWGMQGNLPILGNCALYPGQSITINGNYDFGVGTGFSFYNKHCEYRNGTKVVKSKKSGT